VRGLHVIAPPMLWCETLAALVAPRLVGSRNLGDAHEARAVRTPAAHDCGDGLHRRPAWS
jgi:hypothetical protein